MLFFFPRDTRVTALSQRCPTRSPDSWQTEMLQDYVEKLKKKCQANHPISLSYLWANAVELLYLREPFGKNSLLQLHLHRQCGRCLGLKFQRHRSKNVTVWSGRLIFFVLTMHDWPQLYRQRKQSARKRKGVYSKCSCMRRKAAPLGKLGGGHILN